MELLITFVLLACTAFTSLIFFVAATKDVKGSYFIASLICALAFILRVALLLGARISFGA